QLQHAGGYLKVLPEGAAGPLYILAGDRRTFTVLSPVCTHLGCTVNIEGALLVCPCHGSTYDRSGAVLRGPAERPLRRYAASVTEQEELVIQLEEGR
ncbi:MAG TPA: ubiquinol-cytochrome c reductase iron-sulfur subunit, partial [Longimicrobium sp.]|nr:ubiquinol-cytochrome c reductase iron-sulfur subunit [Longimicrobium sp.]